MLVTAIALAIALTDEGRTEEAPPPVGLAPGLSMLTKIPVQLSTECKVKSPAFEGRSALRVVRRALREKRPVRVLAVGTSTTLGAGASSAITSYPVRLENDLEGFLKGFEVDMFSRGLSGEIAEDAAERMQMAVADLKPDLVVWQVGTADALARVDIADFEAPLRRTLHWLAENHIDVVLIDPQYIDHLKDDGKYNEIVKTIGDVAREERVLLVRRYEAMASLSADQARASAKTGDGVALTDLGYRCMAEYAARAIVAGILQADVEQMPKN
jgi:acyl-CoA thioesterase I